MSCYNTTYSQIFDGNRSTLWFDNIDTGIKEWTYCAVQLLYYKTFFIFCVIFHGVIAPYTCMWFTNATSLLYRLCRGAVKPWWRHQMERFSALLALCVGIQRWPVDSPQKGQWRRALMFYLICAWTTSRASNRDDGDWDAIALIMTPL